MIRPIVLIGMLAVAAGPFVVHADEPIDILDTSFTSPVVFENTHIADAPYGIRLIGVSNVTITGCTIERVGGAAITIRRSSQVTIEGCTVRQSGEEGTETILIDDATDVVLKDVIVDDARTPTAIRVTGGSNVTIADSTIERTIGDGIIAVDVNGLRMENVTSTGNWGNGLVLAGDITIADIVASFLTDNRKNGLWITGTTGGVAMVDTVLSGNRYYGADLAWAVQGMESARTIYRANGRGGVRMEGSCTNGFTDSVFDQKGTAAVTLVTSSTPSEPAVEAFRAAGCAVSDNRFVRPSGVGTAFLIITAAGESRQTNTEEENVVEVSTFVVHDAELVARHHTGAVLGVSHAVGNNGASAGLMLLASFGAIALLGAFIAVQQMADALQRTRPVAWHRYHGERRQWRVDPDTLTLTAKRS